MSFSSLPDEVICQIFSHLSSIDDVGDKIRLERVSKRFQRLSQDGRSWKFNTKLDLDAFRSGEDWYEDALYHIERFPDSVIAFLARVPEVKTLRFRYGEETDYLSEVDLLSQLFLHLPKLKIKSLYYSSSLDSNSDDCGANVQLVTWCLVNFQSTLTKFEFECCFDPECRTLAAVVKLLPLCHKLTHSNIAKVDLGEIPLLEMLAGRQLEHVNFGSCRNLTAELAAALLNSVPGRTVRYFNPSRIQLDFAKFIEAVKPAVLSSLKGLGLHDSNNGFLRFAPKLLELCPNLEEFFWNVNIDEQDLVTALDIAEMLDQVFHSQRPKPLLMRLTVERKRRGERDSFGQDLWRQICLLDISKSGTKRGFGMKYWHREFKRGKIECEVSFRSYRYWCNM